MDKEKLQELLQFYIDGAIDEQDFVRGWALTIASSENAIQDVLIILEEERKKKERLMYEFNLNLSRAIVILDGDIPEKKEFVLEEIEKFYKDNKIKKLFEKNNY